MLAAADPRKGALQAYAEAGVRYRTVLAKVQIPAVRLLGKLLLMDPGQELRQYVFALGPAR